MDEIRFRIASWLHLQAVKIHDDWHEWTLTTKDGEKITFGCYYQYALSWSDTISEDCSCPVE